MGDPLRGLLRARRRLPLWARWVATILVYLAAIAVVVVVVHSLASESSSNQRKSEASAVSEANKVGRVAIAQDEAPHTARSPAHTPAGAALERAISADVKRRIAAHELTGPLQKVRCVPLGRGSVDAAPFRCTVQSAGIPYEFRAVADGASAQLTWCKVDRAPEGDAALEVALSSRCLR